MVSVVAVKDPRQRRKLKINDGGLSHHHSALGVSVISASQAYLEQGLLF